MEKKWEEKKIKKEEEKNLTFFQTVENEKWNIQIAFIRAAILLTAAFTDSATIRVCEYKVFSLEILDVWWCSAMKHDEFSVEQLFSFEFQCWSCHRIWFSIMQAPKIVQTCIVTIIIHLTVYTVLSTLKLRFIYHGRSYLHNF